MSQGPNHRASNTLFVSRLSRLQHQMSISIIFNTFWWLMQPTKLSNASIDSPYVQKSSFTFISRCEFSALPIPGKLFVGGFKRYSFATEKGQRLDAETMFLPVSSYFILCQSKGNNVATVAFSVFQNCSAAVQANKQSSVRFTKQKLRFQVSGCCPILSLLSEQQSEHVNLVQFRRSCCGVSGSKVVMPSASPQFSVVFLQFTTPDSLCLRGSPTTERNFQQRAAAETNVPRPTSSHSKPGEVFL